MKPVSLKIKGLNSFVEQQTIEFSKLTEKGLFGIFGPTASGKSTILDGITIALYGKVSRDTKEFVNTETNVVEISFDFEIGLGKGRTSYRAERCIKRLKTGNFKTAYARLIEINKENPDENKVIAEGPRDLEENVISIVGLKVEDFTRSVVLPQGKFNEFLKLSGKDRRDMLERIFALEKYGSKLYDKIKKVRNENLNTKTLLEGEMKGYENVDEESHNQLKQTLIILKEEEKGIKLQKSTLDKEYEVYKNIFELQKEKSQYVKKEDLLKLQEEDIENKKVKFTKGNLALNVKPYIENVSETQKSLTINGEKLQKLVKDYEFVSQKLESTKISYEEAFQYKNDKLPTLIEKEVSLKQASNIEEKIIYLANEKDGLLKKHKELTNNIVDKNSKTSIVLINKEKLEKELQVCETKLNKIEILPEYREKLYKTYNSELEVNSAAENVLELKNKGEILKKTLSSTESLHNNAKLKLKDKENKLVLLEEKSVELANDFPGDNNLLLEKQEVYNTLKVNLEKAVENHKINDELNGKYEIINTKNEKVRLNIENVEKAIETMKDKGEKLEGEIKEIEIGNMAVVLASNLQEGDLCPVCGAEHHPKVAELKADTNLKVLKNLKQSVAINLENLSKDYQNELIKLAGFSKDEQYINSQLLEVTKNLKDINIKELEEEKKRSELSLLHFKERIELYNKQKTNLEVVLTKSREEKSKAAMDEAKLGEGLRKESEALLVLQNDISIASERLELLSQSHKLLNEDLLREEDSFKQKQNENERSMSIKEKILQIKRIDNEVIKLTSQVRKDRSELVTLEKERVDLDKTLRELTNLKTEIETSGKEKRAEIERLTLQIVELCGFTPTKDHTPKIEVEKVRAQIKEITLKESSLKSVFERESVEKQNVLTQKTSEENKKEMLSKMLMEGQEKLNISLNENLFEDTETVLMHLISRGLLVIFEKEIKQYEELKRNLIDNLKRLEILLQGKEVDVTLFEKLKEEREVIGTVLEEKTKAIGAQFRALVDMERKMEEIKTLLIKKKSVEHKLGLLRELDTLIQGNKFVEYVAMKQLKYISMEASKRLKEITRGRYALELDASGAFVMRDDFNGGIRRETNTLSGGETFLTSLCLALALSSQIQLKGSAPLEFFFLDEGFGTLDTDLLDIVMNSLEKLHSSTLSVGIISHVEELRNRVPIKLIVTPAEQGQGGSKVKLEYT
ncbi:AAA family ATPase [Clostridium estertheticum]|uniref:AAA family ATPase n=1 Tax=Clostridium estertheticum TaxID=238834 RepID=UPI001C6E9808|nr:AAA family ATPase [Clostridium estertheticum]MBW9170112.1 AAA family ATPase [Clostridium estertheticum]WLC75540.1 AAA family ATPase [Clostridium estertheticum]